MGHGTGEAFSFHPLPHGFLVGHLFSFQATLLLAFTNHKRKPPGGYSWKCLVGCAARFSKSWPYFSQKNVIFRTRFRTWPLKSIPVFRPEGDHKTQHKHWNETEIMSSLLRLKLQQKHFLKSIPNLYITLSFLFIWNNTPKNRLRGRGQSQILAWLALY